MREILLLNRNKGLKIQGHLKLGKNSRHFLSLTALLTHFFTSEKMQDSFDVKKIAGDFSLLLWLFFFFIVLSGCPLKPELPDYETEHVHKKPNEEVNCQVLSAETISKNSLFENTVKIYGYDNRLFLFFPMSCVHLPNLLCRVHEPGRSGPNYGNHPIPA
jgi:hypothetical protein